MVRASTCFPRISFGRDECWNEKAMAAWRGRLVAAQESWRLPIKIEISARKAV